MAGLLGAGIMAAVMASDSQILALSTMFTEDVFAFYGGRERFGEAIQVQTGRLFVVLLTVMAYVIALQVPQSIFDLAVQFAFSGYASLSPLLFAALFWPRSTKWGALAVTLWSAFAVIYTARVPGALAWGGLMPVVPMTFISYALMAVVSLVTPPPSPETIARVPTVSIHTWGRPFRAAQRKTATLPIGSNCELPDRRVWWGDFHSAEDSPCVSIHLSWRSSF